MAWESLQAITQEARQFAAIEDTRPPAACPNDGEPLRQGPDWAPYCPFDGWRPDGCH